MRRSKAHHAGGAVSKTRGVIERREVRLVVHVKPRASASAGESGSLSNELQAESLPTKSSVDSRIEQESVLSAVSREIDESNQAVASESPDVAEASCEDGAECAGGVVRPCSREEIVERGVVQRWIDAVFNRGFIAIHRCVTVLRKAIAARVEARHTDPRSAKNWRLLSLTSARIAGESVARSMASRTR